jgi:hypothetical protein
LLAVDVAMCSLRPVSIAKNVFKITLLTVDVVICAGHNAIIARQMDVADVRQKGSEGRDEGAE